MFESALLLLWLVSVFGLVLSILRVGLILVDGMPGRAWLWVIVFVVCLMLVLNIAPSDVLPSS